MRSKAASICILAFLNLLLFGCSSSNANEAKAIIIANWSMNTTATQSFPPSFREGASIPIIKCGDSHYVHVKDKWAWENRVYELTELDLRIVPEPVTPADKANGIEWRGEAIARCALTRPFFCDEPQDFPNCRPFTWSDCAPLRLPNYGLIKKSDGTWMMTPGMSDFSCETHPACLPLSCVDVQSLPRAR